VIMTIRIALWIGGLLILGAIGWVLYQCLWDQRN
jgi:hypothetical protein